MSFIIFVKKLQFLRENVLLSCENFFKKKFISLVSLILLFKSHYCSFPMYLRRLITEIEEMTEIPYYSYMSKER